MRYLLVILEDEAIITPDPDIFEFDDDDDERPDLRNAAECLDRILDACDPEKLGKRAVYEIPPDHYNETARREGTAVAFHFSMRGTLA